MNTLKQFQVADKFYSQIIFSEEDDRVELQDQDGNVILIFTADCDVFHNGIKLGTWSMHGNTSYVWRFEFAETTLPSSRFEPYPQNVLYRDLIEAEIQFSRNFLLHQLVVKQFTGTESQ